MPYETSPSIVAPRSGAYLWIIGITGVAITAAVALTMLPPGPAGFLIAVSLMSVLAGWATNRRAASTAAERANADATPELQPVAVDRRLLESLFEALADPVLVVAGGEVDDIAGRRVVLANAAARELFRIPREGALLVSALRDPTVLEAIDEALFGGLTREIGYTGTGAQTRHWKALTRPLLSVDQEPLALVVLRDETDVRRMELMRVDFLANASHELRTPLASLSGFIETLKGHARDDPKARDKFLDIMALQTDRMGRLVADLLSLSRIELNEHIPPAGRVDLTGAAADVVDAVSVLSADRKVQVLLLDRTLQAPVHGDRDEIVQVVQNLVDNAIKYSAAGDTIEILVQPDVPLEQASAPWSGGNRGEGATRLPLVTPDREPGQHYAAISVRDHGPGLAREHLPRLTERFYRVEGQKSGERAGTGLGLAIVKHIVNRHRGGLTVESAPGQGAVFTAYFPVAPRKSSPSEP